MRIRSSVLVQLALFAVALAYSLFMAARMPDVVPVHWDAAGHVNAYGSKWMNLLIMPGTMLFMALLTVALPKLSPRKFEIEPFEGTYGYAFVLIALLFLAIHVVLVQTSARSALDITKMMMAVLFGFFALFGNVMGKIKRNFYMGIRTPWTLSDERVWHASHRAAGRLWLVGGIIGVLASLFGAPFWMSITFLLVLCFLPILQSYLIYRKIDPQ